MKFLMQGIEIDTTKVKYKPALEDVLLMVTKTYYPDIKLSKVEYDFDEKKNSVILTFYRETKYHLLGDIKDVDAKLISGLPEDVLKTHLDQTIRIPMRETIRSLNLSNSVAIVAYEIFKQQNFGGLEKISSYFD